MDTNLKYISSANANSNLKNYYNPSPLYSNQTQIGQGNASHKKNPTQINFIQNQPNLIQNNQHGFYGMITNETQMLDILGRMCMEVDMMVNKHKEEEYLLDFDLNFQHNYQTQNFPTLIQPLESNQTSKINQTNSQSQGKSILMNKSKSPLRIAQKAYESNSEITNNNQEQSSNSKKTEIPPNDDLIRRLYAFQSKTEAKQRQLVEQRQEQLKQEHPGVPQLTATKKEFQSLKQRVPIYKRIEDEIKKKENKIQQIKEKQETERKMRNAQLGIVDDEEILRMKKEKDLILKGKFNIESFEQRYEREIKQLFDKQKKREQERQNKDVSNFSFTPNLKASSKAKSPLQSTRNQGLEMSKSNNKQGVKNKIKQLELQKMMTPSFKPNLNQLSMRIVQNNKDSSKNSTLNSNRRNRMNSDDDLQRHFKSLKNDLHYNTEDKFNNLEVNEEERDYFSYMAKTIDQKQDQNILSV
ncbi:UNKNOWN [Stylonychia lemnae]|uniref:Uncharacterized protein n=1 Tax=Stylonychia lemnae TaxID=5949 RepID=A0A078AAL4_STYLE|nr:UNKNOWN [Stylonychia lemnae]|eukprot:CDW77838.1 UNKNOWN [Stylonychia lemnae]